MRFGTVCMHCSLSCDHLHKISLTDWHLRFKQTQLTVMNDTMEVLIYPSSKF